MTNEKLKDILADIVEDEEELNQMIVLEGDEFAGGCVGVTHDNHLVYDYDLLVESLINHGWEEMDAVEWLDYNTLGSLGYMANVGKEPIIITRRIADFK